MLLTRRSVSPTRTLDISFFVAIRPTFARTSTGDRVEDVPCYGIRSPKCCFMEGKGGGGKWVSELLMVKW